jgi:hypothetical protein
MVVALTSSYAISPWKHQLLINTNTGEKWNQPPIISNPGEKGSQPPIISNPVEKGINHP